jgi:hypothetical protein
VKARWRERRGGRAIKSLGTFVLTPLLTLFLAGCFQGYPGETAPLISPFEMGSEQRLAALNEIGERAHPTRRWAFALDQQCQLQMDFKRQGSSKLQQVFVLDRSLTVDLAFDKEDRTFDIHLMAGFGDDAQKMGTLLESSAWTQASQMELLLQLLIRDCGHSESV